MYNFSNLPENIIGDFVNKTGITRKIDDLGRIVIPKEIRKNLKIKDNDELEISTTDDAVILRKYDFLKKDQVIECFIKSIGRFYNINVLYTARDKVIDYFLKNKKIMNSNVLSDYVIKIINNREMVEETSKIKITDEELEISYIICPLIINGDLIGSIILYDDDINDKILENIGFFKLFLENYIE